MSLKQGVDAREQRGIEVDRILVRRQARHQLGLQLQEGSVAVGGDQIGEAHAHAREHSAAALEGSALGEDTHDRIEASSALAAITVPGGELRDYVKGGAAVELVWIIAQQQGLSVQPVSPVFLYAHDRAEIDHSKTGSTPCDC